MKTAIFTALTGLLIASAAQAYTTGIILSPGELYTCGTDQVTCSACSANQPVAPAPAPAPVQECPPPPVCPPPQTIVKYIQVTEAAIVPDMNCLRSIPTTDGRSLADRVVQCQRIGRGLNQCQNQKQLGDTVDQDCVQMVRAKANTVMHNDQVQDIYNACTVTHFQCYNEMNP